MIADSENELYNNPVNIKIYMEERKYGRYVEWLVSCISKAFQDAFGSSD